MIMVADRGATEHHQQIAVLQAPLCRRRNRLHIVLLDGQAIGHSAPGLRQARNAKAYGIENLERSRFGSGCSQFVPAAQDRDPRRAYDTNLCRAAGGHR